MFLSCEKIIRVLIYCLIALVIAGLICVSTFLKFPSTPHMASSSIKSSSIESSSAVFETTLRILKPELIDDVVADQTKSDSGTLAAALMWTRKRESKLYTQNSLLRIEIQNLHKKLEIRENKSRVQTPETKLSFCIDEGFEEVEMISRTGTIADLNSGKFHFWICADSKRLCGIIRIHKEFGCNENDEFSKDPLYSNFVRTKIGPDEFVLGLEGPELHSLTLMLKYKGNCTYDMPFEVSTPGLYHLNLVWLREHYVGAQEGTVGWLEGQAYKPLGDNCFVNLSITNDHMVADSILKQHHEKKNSANQLLPMCDLRCPNYTYIPGRWVYRKKKSSLIFHRGPHPFYHRKVTNTQLHTWIRLEDFSWLPINCALPNFSQAQILRSLVQKKILFEGDSHMRMLYNSLLTFSCGPQDEWSGWESQCGGNCKTQNLHQVCMEKDGTASSSAYIKRSSNVTFFNFGQHFCDGDRHRTFQEYRLHVDHIISKIGKMTSREKSRLVWHETNMMPFRTDTWIQAFGDQRTNTKILAYNWYATKEMKKIGIPIIPAFAQSLPLFSGSRDMAHIPGEFIAQSSLKFVFLFISQSDISTHTIPMTMFKTTQYRT